jgi:hypothetical protein
MRRFISRAMAGISGELKEENSRFFEKAAQKLF